jgi:hypothetical protein
MYHNAQGFAIGDQNVMSKLSEYLKKVSNGIASIYAEKSGRKIEKIKKEMDEETYLFGDEIVKAGFADEIIKTEKVKNKDENILNAMLEFDKCKNTISESGLVENDIKNLMNYYNPEKEKTKTELIPDNSGAKILNLKREARRMNKEQLRIEHPELYNEIYESGKKAAYDNVNAHLEWIEADPESVKKAINSKEDFTMAHLSAYNKKAYNKVKLDETVAENIPAVETKTETLVDDIDSRVHNIAKLVSEKSREVK